MVDFSGPIRIGFLAPIGFAVLFSGFLLWLVFGFDMKFEAFGYECFFSDFMWFIAIGSFLGYLAALWMSWKLRDDPADSVKVFAYAICVAGSLSVGAGGFLVAYLIAKKGEEVLGVFRLIAKRVSFPVVALIFCTIIFVCLFRYHSVGHGMVLDRWTGKIQSGYRK